MKNILLVDDEERILESISELMSDHFNVITANNGNQALNILEAVPSDCMVLDIVMPGMSGLDVLERIRDDGNDLPVIMMTGNSHLACAEKCANLGVSGYLSKPFDVDELINKINSIFNSFDKDRENNDKKSALHPKLSESLEYIDQFYQSNINVQIVYRKIGISYGHLANLFTKELGMNFTCYLNRFRVGKAKKLIKETDDTLSEIMTMVGFRTEQHFFKQFKRFAGITPNSLRK